MYTPLATSTSNQSIRTVLEQFRAGALTSHQDQTDFQFFNSDLPEELTKYRSHRYNMYDSSKNSFDDDDYINESRDLEFASNMNLKNDSMCKEPDGHSACAGIDCKECQRSTMSVEDSDSYFGEENSKGEK